MGIISIKAHNPTVKREDVCIKFYVEDDHEVSLTLSAGIRVYYRSECLYSTYSESIEALEEAINLARKHYAEMQKGIVEAAKSGWTFKTGD